MNTKDAEALLAAAEHDLECKAERPCEACGAREEARLTIRRLGFTPDTLRVAIKLAAALRRRVDKCHCDRPDGCPHDESAEALAAWEALGSKEEA